MLAYVFWHQRASTTDPEDYRDHLRRFHSTLNQRPPQGFLCSFVLEMHRLPWMSQDYEVFEDWYVVDNSAALDALDISAVTGICRDPHDQVARLAGNGTGGLYRLKAGMDDPSTVSAIRCATWMSKPAGMSYDQMNQRLQEWSATPQIALWQRQMTMGPAMEYRWHSEQPLATNNEIPRIEVDVSPMF